MVSSLSAAGATFLGASALNAALSSIASSCASATRGWAPPSSERRRCAGGDGRCAGGAHRIGGARCAVGVGFCAGGARRAGVVRVGRAADNDVVLPELFVSRHHAEFVRQASGEWEVVDLGGHDGTFVDGRRVGHEIVRTGQQIAIGQSLLRLTDAGLQLVEAPGQPILEARGASAILPSGQTILDDVSFSLAENTLVAIVGTTGSGKSTLLKTLTGFRPPEMGQILVNGLDLYEAFGELGRRIGYVPQDDILHPQLSVRRALEFGAELRFPSDVSRPERRARVEEVMVELGLADRADVAIERLSGGQRKRTSVAMELLTKPTLLLLDEPTSGLDPGYEKSVMELLRRLADGGRVVVVVTHSVQSLDLCDRVLFLAPGGQRPSSGRRPTRSSSSTAPSTRRCFRSSRPRLPSRGSALVRRETRGHGRPRRRRRGRSAVRPRRRLRGRSGGGRCRPWRAGRSRSWAPIARIWPISWPRSSYPRC